MHTTQESLLIRDTRTRFCQESIHIWDLGVFVPQIHLTLDKNQAVLACPSTLDRSPHDHRSNLAKYPVPSQSCLGCLLTPKSHRGGWGGPLLCRRKFGPWRSSTRVWGCVSSSWNNLDPAADTGCGVTNITIKYSKFELLDSFIFSPNDHAILNMESRQCFADEVYVQHLCSRILLSV